MRQLSPVPCSSQSNIFDVSADDLGSTQRRKHSFDQTFDDKPEQAALDGTLATSFRELPPIADTAAHLFQQHQHPHHTTRFLHAVSTLYNPV